MDFPLSLLKESSLLGVVGLLISDVLNPMKKQEEYEQKELKRLMKKYGIQR